MILFRWDRWTYPQRMECPFQAEWRGKLLVEQAGEYEIEVSLEDTCSVYVGGREVFAGRYQEKLSSEKIQLAQGEHDIRIVNEEAGLMRTMVLYWARDGGERQVVPYRNLRPY